MATQLLRRRSDLLSRVDVGPLHETFLLRGVTVAEHLRWLKSYHRWLYDRLDHERWSPATLAEYVADLGEVPGHFEHDGPRGRGDSYRQAQKLRPLMRRRGISALFRCFDMPPSPLGPGTLIVDALGGNGTLTRAIRLIAKPHRMPAVITSDSSPEMIRDAVDQGLPALRQSAQRSLLADCTVDGVLFAYGTHHIPVADRPAALHEAWRVLQRGGRVVLQDFEEGTPTARWYSELLHEYTTTGHANTHFTRDGVARLLREAGFRSVHVMNVYDPFVVDAATALDARRQMIEHIVLLFGLRRLEREPGEEMEEYVKRVEATFMPYTRFARGQLPVANPATNELAVFPIPGGYRAELPRVALVATGIRGIR